MTRQRHDSHSTEFGRWLRGQHIERDGRVIKQETDVRSIGSRMKYIDTSMFPIHRQQSHQIESLGYDGENLDYAWLCYGPGKMGQVGKIMLLEEKRCFGNPSRYGNQGIAQIMTHSVLDTALRFACQNGALFTYTKGQVMGKDPPGSLQYYGYHLIRFQQTYPEDGWTEIDGTRVDIDQLLQFLRFEWFPIDPDKCTPFYPIRPGQVVLGT